MNGADLYRVVGDGEYLVCRRSGGHGGWEENEMGMLESGRWVQEYHYVKLFTLDASPADAIGPLKPSPRDDCSSV